MIHTSRQLENINLQLYASYLFLLSNILSITSTYELKCEIEGFPVNGNIKKTAKIAVSLQMIGIIIFLIISLDDYKNNPSKSNLAFYNANILSTISNIIRIQAIFNPSTEFEGSADIS